MEQSLAITLMTLRTIPARLGSSLVVVVGIAGVVAVLIGILAMAVGFAVSVGLYLPTLLIGGGRWPTVTTEAVALAAGGDRRVIGATALIQALLPFVGFAAALLVPAFLFRNRRAMRTGE